MKAAIIGSMQVPDFTIGEITFYSSLGYYTIRTKDRVLKVSEDYVYEIPSIGYCIKKIIYKIKNMFK